MRLRIVFVIAATVAIAACSESTTAPRTLRPGARSADIIECRSGYHVATRSDGTEVCEPDAESLMTRPDSTE